MSILPILQDPDPKLREISQPIDERELNFSPAIRKLCGDMLDTMRKHHAWGLSAIQLGVPLRLMACNPRTGIPFSVLVNPTIIRVSTELQRSSEGCLSIQRGKSLLVPLMRPARLSVTFFDRAWQPHGLDCQKLAAVVIQHEVDHMDGRLITDYAAMARAS